jgi:hypothetical protein
VQTSNVVGVRYHDELPLYPLGALMRILG